MIPMPDSPRRFDWVWNLTLLAAGGLIALYLYRPWVVLPFDVWDFREFLPLLSQSESVRAQFDSLTEYYATHGRMNLAFYATFVAQWQAFGMEPWGWQVWRFTLMMVNLVLIFLLLRRFHCSRWGAAAGAVLYLVASPVQRGWVQLMAEPQALMLLLIAALLASEYQRVQRWRLYAAGIAALILLVLLSKEVVGVAGGLILGLALVGTRNGVIVPPSRTGRNLVLFGLVGVVVASVGLLLLAIRSQPAAEGYSMVYGAGGVPIGRLVDNLTRMVLPHQVGGDLALGMLYPTNLAFILVVVLGWYRRLRTETGIDRQAMLQLAGVLAVPVVGALAYWPWPKWDSFYALPFFMGSALLVGLAVTTLSAGGRAYRALAMVAPLVILVYSGVAAQRSLATAEASLRLNGDLARAFGDIGPGGRIVVAGPTTGPRALPVRAFELKEYAAAVGLVAQEHLPLVFEAECDALPGLLAGGFGTIVVASYSYGCGRLAGASVSLRRPFAYRDWITFERRDGVISVDLVRVDASR